MNPATTTSRLDEGLQIPGAIVHDPFENYHWWNGDITSPTNPNPPECCIACCSKPLCCRPRDKYEIAFTVLRMVEFAIGLFCTINFFRVGGIVYIIEFWELSPMFCMVCSHVPIGKKYCAKRYPGVVSGCSWITDDDTRMRHPPKP
jgi:hypothetical protein